MDILESILPKGINSVHLVYGTGVAVVGVIGGALAYNSIYSFQTQLNDEESARKHPRLLRQIYRLNRDLLDDDDSEEDSSDGLLILHQTPRGRRTPCIAPFALKLETFLRIHNIKYEVDFESKEPRTTNCPWISLQYENVIDAQNCLDYLCQEYQIDQDTHLNDEECAISRAFHAMLEHHCYWGIVLHRYVYGGIERLRKIQYLPPTSQKEIPKICEAIEKGAWYHGIGKLEPIEVAHSVVTDIETLSCLLGEKEYFFGKLHPSELDCTVFAILAQMLWTMPDSPYYEAIQYRYSNLKDFCCRMRKTFWPDWDNCLHNIPWDLKDDDQDGYY